MKHLMSKLEKILVFLIKIAIPVLIDLLFLLVIYLIILNYVIDITNRMKLPVIMIDVMQVGFALKLVDILINFFMKYNNKN